MSGDDLGDVQVPDDLSGLTAAQSPTVAVVVTQVAVADALAAACSLAGVDVDAVPSPVGALAVLRDPAAGLPAAGAVSRLLRQAPVVLLERRDGKITASQWVGGEHQKDLPAGLVLSGAPPVLEDLLLGELPVGEVEGVVSSVGLSRWKAMRMLAAHRR
ncbi:hypothetical protein [Cellulomonas wangsupingiae]|uniref:Uncharacterized protein n=1 Tax=Cellulomonas wangsupingiae TaxID=2968085 RepID=A0ABY5K897_9CELL|nr:hypothetical protein [Cellulomonas wangsupingiae]MCC2335176.1 hypothetical protein [Cellulomonas wangsupingiae]MCM0639205.1 hypothetical protein [Cellulomonas wangsupingiae]UUI66676.1 hypothetical protein NP075_08250 [Cellulomonas wangsupingiae]